MERKITKNKTNINTSYNLYFTKNDFAMSESIIYKTTPEQKLRIKEGREQIARGEYFTNEQVELEIDKWLKEK